MKLLQVNWEEGSLRAFNVASEEAIDKDQDTLRSVNEEVLDLIKIETDRTGVIQFRRAMIDSEEDEESGEETYSVADWELIT